MIEIGHHSHDVVLDVAEVEGDVRTGGHFILFVAAFREASDDVGFPTEETHGGHYFFAAETNLAEEVRGVVRASGEDVVFDLVSFFFDVVDRWAKTVDNVVSALLVSNSSMNNT